MPASTRNGAIENWTIGVLGYGNQGRAQAWNLRDSGLTVRVGARRGGSSASQAARDGFPVDDPESLGRSTDLIALLTPDQTHRSILEMLVREASRTKVVVLAHGFALRFQDPPLREDWDVVLVAPSGPGTALRMQDRAGRIPALVAVHRDRSGQAGERARAYAVSAGCSERALLATSVAEEAEVDLFGEQVVLCGGLTALVTAAWETLVERGYDPELAYLECVHQIGLTSAMITRYGIAGMRERISPLALYGDLSRGPRLIDAKVRGRMAEILEEIRTGRFALEWTAEVESGFPLSRDGCEQGRHHPLEGAGSRIRGSLESAVPDRGQTDDPLSDGETPA